jgi:hypothetical protein
VYVGLEAVDEGAADHHAVWVRVEQGHEVVDVRGGQAKRLDLGQLGIARNVRDALAKVGKRVVDRLQESPN